MTENNSDGPVEAVIDSDRGMMTKDSDVVAVMDSDVVTMGDSR